MMMKTLSATPDHRFEDLEVEMNRLLIDQLPYRKKSV
jgi:hypothetical protein